MRPRQPWQKQQLLTHPRKDAPTALTTDASDEAVGAVLQQQIYGAWLPLAFFSKQLRPGEKSTVLLIRSF